jgi:hypothetical protein
MSFFFLPLIKPYSISTHQVQTNRNLALGTNIEFLETLTRLLGPQYDGPAVAFSADGSCIVVGHPYDYYSSIIDPSFEGSIYVYKKQQDDTWNQSAVLSDTEGRQGNLEHLGASVAVSADCSRIVAGGPDRFPSGERYYERVVVFDLDDTGDWKLTARLQQGTVLTNGEIIDMPWKEANGTEPIGGGFGQKVFVSTDGRRIAIDEAASNGGVFDVDQQGNVTPVGNTSALAMSADGNRIVRFDYAGTPNLGIQLLNYDGSSEGWAVYGDHIIIPWLLPGSIVMSGSGDRLFLKASPNVFVIEDFGGGFKVTDNLYEAAKQFDVLLDSGIGTGMGTTFHGELFVIGNLAFHQENTGQWSANSIADELLHWLGPRHLSLSPFGTFLVTSERDRSTSPEEYVVRTYSISTKSVPGPEPTPLPTEEPGPTVEPTSELPIIRSPELLDTINDLHVECSDSYGRRASIALSEDGSCLVVGRSKTSHVGEVSVYMRQQDSTWERNAVLNGKHYFGNSVAVSADCTRIVVGAPCENCNISQPHHVRVKEASVVIFDLEKEKGEWKKSVTLQYGTPLANGGIIEPLSTTFGSTVMMSGDGRRILVVVGAASGRFFDVDSGGIVTALSDFGEPDNPTLLMSADGTRVLDYIYKGFQILDYDLMTEKWIPYGNNVDVFIESDEGYRVYFKASSPVAMNASGSRLFVPVNIQVARGFSRGLFVMDDTANGFVVTQILDEVAQQAGLEFIDYPSSYVKSVANDNGDLVVLFYRANAPAINIFREYNGGWTGAGLSSGLISTAVATISADGNVMATARTTCAFQIDIFDISAGPTPEPTPEPTLEATTPDPTPEQTPEPPYEPTPAPTFDLSGITVQLIDSFSLPDTGSGPIGYAFAINADGSCLIVGIPYYRSIYSPGEVHIYKRQNDTTWVPSTVLKGGDSFGYSVAVSADCTRIVVGSPCGHCLIPSPFYEKVSVFDLVGTKAWNATAILQYGTPLTNGETIDVYYHAKIGNYPCSHGLGKGVAVSADGTTIFLIPGVVNGNIFDVDMEGNIMPVVNATVLPTPSDESFVAALVDHVQSSGLVPEDHRIGQTMLSSDNKTLALFWSNYESQEQGIYMFDIAPGLEPTPEPTPNPTSDDGVPTAIVESVGYVSGPDGPWPYFDPFPSRFSLSADGKCLVAHYVHNSVEGDYLKSEGRVLVYERNLTSEWVQTAEFAANGTWFGPAIAVSADCTRIAFFVRRRDVSPDTRIAVYNRDQETWNLAAEVRNGTSLVNGGSIDLPFSGSFAMSEDGSVFTIQAADNDAGGHSGKIYILNITRQGSIFGVGKPIIERNVYTGSGAFTLESSIALSSSGSRIVAAEPVQGAWQYAVFNYERSTEEWTQYGEPFVPEIGNWSLAEGPKVNLEMNKEGNQYAFNTEASDRDEFTVSVLQDTGGGFETAADLRQIAREAGLNVSDSYWTRDQTFSMARSKNVIAVLSPAPDYPALENGGKVYVFRRLLSIGVWRLVAEIFPRNGLVFPGIHVSGAISLSGDGSILGVMAADPGHPNYGTNSGIAVYQILYVSLP